jgi:hypothetical protein
MNISTEDKPATLEVAPGIIRPPRFFTVIANARFQSRPVSSSMRAIEGEQE